MHNPKLSLRFTFDSVYSLYFVNAQRGDLCGVTFKVPDASYRGLIYLTGLYSDDQS